MCFKRQFFVVGSTFLAIFVYNIGAVDNQEMKNVVIDFLEIHALDFQLLVMEKFCIGKI